jgi:heptosyltransferase-2
MHVASAVGIPIVGVFGPSNHVSWGPYGAAEWGSESLDNRRAVVVRYDLPCAPCLYRGFVPGTPRGCRSRDCLTLVEPATVAAAALALLASAGRTSGR